MTNSTSEINFRDLSTPEKFYFFEDCNNTTLNALSENNLNTFLKKIILDSTENNNIRKNALTTFINYVTLGKINKRRALNLLIDEWGNNSDLFLDLQRLKDLFLFYSEDEDEIETIYTQYLDKEEAELVSESYFNLGLINMQKGLTSEEKEKSLIYLEKSKNYFSKSNEVIENRTDAQFYNFTVSIIIDNLRGYKNSVQQNLQKAANILFNMESFSFGPSIDSFYIGFYRILNSLNKIEQDDPNNWLDFRSSLNKLFTQYSEINNQFLKERLNKSLVSTLFKDMVENKFIEPYFTLNFQAQISKINLMKEELEPDSDHFEFLNRIESLALNKNLKKKMNQIKYYNS